jgi:hypothetical protein
MPEAPYQLHRETIPCRQGYAVLCLDAGAPCVPRRPQQRLCSAVSEERGSLLNAGAQPGANGQPPSRRELPAGVRYHRRAGVSHGPGDPRSGGTRSASQDRVEWRAEQDEAAPPLKFGDPQGKAALLPPVYTDGRSACFILYHSSGSPNKTHIPGAPEPGYFAYRSRSEWSDGCLIRANTQHAYVPVQPVTQPLKCELPPTGSTG